MIKVAARLRLVAVALAIASAIVIAANAAIGIIVGEPLLGGASFGLIDAPDVALLQLIDAAIPMAVLALFGSRSRRLWWIAGVLTAAFWAYLVIQVWHDSRSGFEGGANIGMGLLMLASPFVILICVGLARLIVGPAMKP